MIDLKSKRDMVNILLYITLLHIREKITEYIIADAPEDVKYGKINAVY